MKPAERIPPSEEDIDRLLASRFKDTTPEFERRWVDLKRQLRTAPPSRPWFAWPRLAPWFGVAVAGAAAVWLLVLQRPAPPAVPTQPSPALAELFAMDEVLARAMPLLDAENRDALLHLPANLPHST
ncbi:MAG: hypothetical protein PHQ04_00610 [Opitutaceae bacterium]|nr:hypothetical protein [Opitutaceae bacterium]